MNFSNNSKWLYKPVLVLLIQFCSLIVLAQKDSSRVSVAGYVFSDQGTPVSGSYIKLAYKKDGRIIGYLNTGDRNYFKISFSCNIPDTFLLSASHISFSEVTDTIVIKEAGELKLSLTLPVKSSLLPEVVVTTPPVIIRGDTTFFNLDFFKEGDEKKLKDFIANIPGFVIDEQGNLIYKGQKVEKIMIDGQELFADKIWTLLNSVPAHVLRNIQILENQSSKKLLKGISGEKKVYMNLGLKKEKLRTAFGDIEAGVGPQSRYLLKPSLFSIFGKVKLGVISNLNNRAGDEYFKQVDEIKTEHLKQSEKWMIRSGLSSPIYNLGSENYLDRKQQEIKTQLNYGLAPKVSGKSEFSFIKGKQSQAAINHSYLLDSINYVPRIDSTNSFFNPTEFLARQTLTWNINTRTEFESILSAYGNSDQTNNQTIFNQYNSVTQSNNYLVNRWKSFEMKTEFTSRISEKKAAHFLATISRNRLNQKVTNFSDSWAEIFLLPDSSYNLLQLNINNNNLQLNSEFTYMVKTKKGLINASLHFQSTNLELDNLTALVDSSNVSTTIPQSNLSGRGKYNFTTVYAKSERRFQLIRYEPMNLTIKGGLFCYTITENQLRKEAGAIYDISLAQKFTIAKNFYSGASTSFSQSPQESILYRSLIWPSGVNSFQQIAPPTVPLRSFSLSNLFEYEIPKERISLNIFLMLNRSFSSRASSSSFQNFVQVQQDSIISKPLNYFSVSSTNTIPSLFLKAVIEVNGGVTLNDYYIRNEDKLLPGNLEFRYVGVKLKKNIRKKYYLTYALNYSTTTVNTPEEIKNGDQKSSAFQQSIDQRFAVNKKLSFSLNSKFYDNRFSGSYSSLLLLVDFETRFKPKSIPFSFHFNAFNLANEKIYSTTYSNRFFQYSHTIPLINRSFLLGVRYEF